MNDDRPNPREDVETLRLRGKEHRLNAMPVAGSVWCAMIHIDSITDSAMLTRADAVELRDWLTTVIDLTPEDGAPCPCGHSDAMHGEWTDDGVALDCLVAGCHEDEWRGHRDDEEGPKP